MMHNISLPYSHSQKQTALVPVRQPNHGRYGHNQNRRLAQQNNFGKVFSALAIVAITIGLCSFILTHEPALTLQNMANRANVVEVPQLPVVETVRPRTVEVAAPVEAPAQPEVSLPVEAPIVSTHGDGPIKIRLGPGQGYSVFSTLPDGEDAKVIGRSVDNYWWKIDYQGQIGWISTAFVQVTGDANAIPLITDQPLLYPAQVN